MNSTLLQYALNRVTEWWIEDQEQSSILSNVHCFSWFIEMKVFFGKNPFGTQFLNIEEVVYTIKVS